ncbi:MOB kinase activator-like 3 [Paramacrobiotus metropolitanus]|uniref:MOB kinase activator-like 3 n=1 Tax=Paramacrobiotus metropolitanus TaxID=2943436 RepID=UPI0024460551|nr:MOB kinase activator-like 3 [Paramacrobiotus metropolitanus]
MPPKIDKDRIHFLSGHSMFMDFFNRKKTFRPKKHFTPGTLKYSLHKRAMASLVTQTDLKRTVKLPDGEKLEDWIAVHIVDFFNRINLIYGTVSEYCTPQSCPTMSAGHKYEYFWSDGVHYKKPTRMPASQYIGLLLDWVDNTVNDQKVFPVFVDVPFPSNFTATCKKIVSRMYRVFVHIYIHHFDRLMELEAVPHVNLCYKHYYFFITEFDLVSKKELEPLEDLTAQLCQTLPRYVYTE